MNIPETAHSTFRTNETFDVTGWFDRQTDEHMVRLGKDWMDQPFDLSLANARKLHNDLGRAIAEIEADVA